MLLSTSTYGDVIFVLLLNHFFFSFLIGNRTFGTNTQTDLPQVSVNLPAAIKRENIREDNDVYLECKCGF